MELKTWITHFLLISLHFKDTNHFLQGSRVSSCDNCPPDGVCVFLGAYGYHCLCQNDERGVRVPCIRSSNAPKSVQTSTVPRAVQTLPNNTTATHSNRPTGNKPLPTGDTLIPPGDKLLPPYTTGSDNKALDIRGVMTPYQSIPSSQDLPRTTPEENNIPTTTPYPFPLPTPTTATYSNPYGPDARPFPNTVTNSKSAPVVAESIPYQETAPSQTSTLRKPSVPVNYVSERSTSEAYTAPYISFVTENRGSDNTSANAQFPNKYVTDLRYTNNPNLPYPYPTDGLNLNTESSRLPYPYPTVSTPRPIFQNLYPYPYVTTKRTTNDVNSPYSVTIKEFSTSKATQIVSTIPKETINPTLPYPYPTGSTPPPLPMFTNPYVTNRPRYTNKVNYPYAVTTNSYSTSTRQIVSTSPKDVNIPKLPYPYPTVSTPRPIFPNPYVITTKYINDANSPYPITTKGYSTSTTQIVSTSPEGLNIPTLPYPYPTASTIRRTDSTARPFIPNPYPTDSTTTPFIPNPYPTDSTTRPFIPNTYPTDSTARPFFTNPYQTDSTTRPFLPNPYPTDTTARPFIPDPYTTDSTARPFIPDPYTTDTGRPFTPNPYQTVSTTRPYIPDPYVTTSIYTNNPNLPYPYPTESKEGGNGIDERENYGITNNPNLPNPYPQDKEDKENADGNDKDSIKNTNLPYPYPTDGQNGFVSTTANTNIIQIEPIDQPITNNPDLPYPYPTDNDEEKRNSEYETKFTKYEYQSTTEDGKGNTNDFTNNSNLPHPYPTDNNLTTPRQPTFSTIPSLVNTSLTPSEDPPIVTTEKNCKEALSDTAATCTITKTTLDMPPSCNNNNNNNNKPQQYITQLCNGSCSSQNRNCPGASSTSSSQDKLCCDLMTYRNDAIRCLGNSITLDTLVPESCHCTLCSSTPFILKGRVTNIDGSKVLKLGTVFVNDTPVGKTDYQGYFTIFLTAKPNRIILTFDGGPGSNFAPTTTDLDVDLNGNFLNAVFKIPDVSRSNPGDVVINDDIVVTLPKDAYVSSILQQQLSEIFRRLRDSKTNLPILPCSVFYVDMEIGYEIKVNEDSCPGRNTVWRQTNSGKWDVLSVSNEEGKLTWLHQQRQEWYIIGRLDDDPCCLSITVEKSLLVDVFPYTITITSSLGDVTTKIFDHEMSTLWNVTCGIKTITAKRDTDNFKEVNVRLESRTCGEIILDMTVLLEEEHGYIYRYMPQTTINSVRVMSEQDNTMAWHPLGYKGIYTTCMINVLIQCPGNGNIVAVSSSGTNGKTRGRNYGLTEQELIPKQDGGAHKVCLEYRCSGLSLTETEIELTRVNISMKGMKDCKLVDINTKLAQKFSTSGILQSYFTALMPVDAYGDAYGVFQGSSYLSSVDSYQMALGACKSTGGRYGIAFGMNNRNVEFGFSSDIVFDD